MAKPPADDGLGNIMADPADDPCIPTLSRKQRLLGFVGCLLTGVFCLALVPSRKCPLTLQAVMYLPVVYLKARKFALLFNLGSILVFASLAMLRGPKAFLGHMLSHGNLGFTAAYLLCTIATLYAAMHIQSTILTAACAAGEVCARGARSPPDWCHGLLLSRLHSRRPDGPALHAHGGNTQSNFNASSCGGRPSPPWRCRCSAPSPSSPT